MTTQASINKRMAPFIKAMKEESIFNQGRKRDSVRLMRSVKGDVGCIKQSVCLGASYHGFAKGQEMGDYWPPVINSGEKRTKQDKAVTEFAVGIDYRHRIEYQVADGNFYQKAVDLAHQIIQHIIPKSLRPYTYVCDDFAIVLVHEDLNGLSFAAAYQMLRLPVEKSYQSTNVFRNLLDALVHRRDVGLALYWLWFADGGHAPSKPGDGGVFMSTDEEYIIGKDNKHFPTKLRDNFFARRDQLVGCGWGLMEFGGRQKGINPMLEDTGITDEYQLCARDYLRGRLTLAQFEECYDEEVKRTQEYRSRAREALERTRVQ
jgi:hypothetical protein